MEAPPKTTDTGNVNNRTTTLLQHRLQRRMTDAVNGIKVDCHNLAPFIERGRSYVVHGVFH